MATGLSGGNGAELDNWRQDHETRGTELRTSRKATSADWRLGVCEVSSEQRRELFDGLLCDVWTNAEEVVKWLTNANVVASFALSTVILQFG